jgi:hypothetical protein
MAAQPPFTPGAATRSTLEIQLEHMLRALGMNLSSTDFYDSISQSQENTEETTSALELAKAMGHYRGEPACFPVRKWYARKGPITVVHEIELLLPENEHNKLSPSVVEQRIANAFSAQKHIFENVYLYENVPTSYVDDFALLTGKKPRTYLKSEERLCLNTYPFGLYDLIVNKKYVQSQQQYNTELMLAQVTHHVRNHLRRIEN